MLLKTKIIIGSIGFLLLLACVSATYAWYHERNKPPVSKVEYIKVPEIKETVKIKRVEVPVTKVVTLEKEVVVEKLKMPDWFKADTNKQAIASASIPPYEGKTSTVAVIDTKTGVGEIVVKQEPLSLVGFANDKQLYGKVGYSTNQETQVTIGAEWKFFRMGKIKVGVFGEGRAAFPSSNASNGDRQNVEALGGLVITY